MAGLLSFGPWLSATILVCALLALLPEFWVRSYSVLGGALAAKNLRHAQVGLLVGGYQWVFILAVVALLVGGGAALLAPEPGATRLATTPGYTMDQGREDIT